MACLFSSCQSLKKCQYACRTSIHFRKGFLPIVLRHDAAFTSKRTGAVKPAVKPTVYQGMLSASLPSLCLRCAFSVALHSSLTIYQKKNSATFIDNIKT